jgi:hypothetical protein
MKIFAIFSLVIIMNYSHGRYTSDWSINTDTSVTQECLRKSLKHMNFDQDIETALTQTSNVVCHTKLSNGIQIKLTFDLREQRWECFLYKSLVETLDIEYDKCKQIDKDSTPIEPPKQSETNNELITDEEEDDEANIDALNQDIQEKDQNNQAESNEEEAEVPKNNNQNNLGLGGVEQNANREKLMNEDKDQEDVNQNSQGRQSNAGLDNQAQAAENADNQAQAAKNADNQAQAAENADNQAQAAENADNQDQAAEKADNQAQPAEKAGNQETVEGDEEPTDKQSNPDADEQANGVEYQNDKQQTFDLINQEEANDDDDTVKEQ